MGRNNKGFSLIELIVVIAIMAVLVGMLAPQFIRYVERSRMGIDVQNVALLCRTVETYATDNETVPDDIQVLVITSTPVDVETAADSVISDFWKQSLLNAGITTISLKSKSWYADGASSITIEAHKLGNMPYFVETNVKADLSILEGDTLEND